MDKIKLALVSVNIVNGLLNIYLGFREGHMSWVLTALCLVLVCFSYFVFLQHHDQMMKLTNINVEVETFDQNK